MKKVLSIAGWILLLLIALVLSITVLIQTDRVQNLVLRQVTKKLSEKLQTTVKVDHLSIRFFNKLNLEGVVILDRRKDTLLQAGQLQVRITDWFFLKEKAELEYLGLDNAYINLYRTDSVWNYAFLEDAFKTTDPKPKDTAGKIEFSLRDIRLKNIRFSYRDGWIGQDMVGAVTDLELHARKMDMAGKKMTIRSLDLLQPSFTLFDYTGKRPDSLAPRKKQKEKIAGVLQWNSSGWEMGLERLNIRDGSVYFQSETDRKIHPYFDPAHIRFSQISGSMSALTLREDTLSAAIDLRTRERSGFTVNQLRGKVTFHPEAMTFSQLDLRTPHSQLGRFYAMRYQDFKPDMNNFISNVTVEMSLQNSRVSSIDIAYFAPELDGLNKMITVSGNAKGTIENFSTTGLTARYGEKTMLSGNLAMKGLPDLDKTTISLTNGSFSTHYRDVQSVYPDLKKITKPDLTRLTFLTFNGNFNGTINAFTTKGTVSTNLGNVTADARITIPKKGQPTYAGLINTENFQLGKFIGEEQLGNFSFRGNLKGQGFDEAGTIDLNGVVRQLDFNGYTYRNIALDGRLHQKQFLGKAAVQDPNAEVTVNGFINLNTPGQPEINVTAEVAHADLKALGFTKDALAVTGTGRLNFLGSNIDDFIGEAALSDVTLYRGEESYLIDTLNLYSMNIDDRRHIEIRNSDISAIMDGKFKLSELPASISHYLSSYYPTYFKNGEKPFAGQDFTLDVDLKNIEQYTKLIDPKLSGFNYSSVNARVQTDQQVFRVKVAVPLAKYGKYRFEEFVFDGNGAGDSLRMNAGVGSIVFNDSLQLPNTSLSIIAAGDVSDLFVSTAANQTINAANLSASVKHLSDGIGIEFRPSSIVINEKTWRIDKGGALTISRSIVDASEIRIYNGEQQLLISSIPSEIGNSHDIIVELKKVNLGDILPYVLQEPRIQGITSGEVTIEDPLNKFKVYVNAQTDQTRFENDSIGITTLNGYYDKKLGKISFNLESENPGYEFLIDGRIDIPDTATATIDAFIDLKETRISILETYLSDIFSKMEGNATGRIRVQGDAVTPELLGSVKLSNAGVEIDYTKVYYRIDDTEILFKPGMLDIGEIRLTDPLGNRGTVTGKMKHRFFDDMEYDFRASSNKILAMNTNRFDNDLFYGRAVARVNFRFSGPEKNMKLYINGAAVDSSRITIETSGSSSKQTGEVDYIRWRQYGREMNPDSIERENSNLTMDFDLAASPVLKMTVVLDPLTGDSITATGSGILKILTGTNEALTINGRYNIESGAYNFNFQDIFNKPFTIEQNSGSFLSWTGDPYNAEININAKYVAEKVRMSSLFESSNSSGVSTVNSDVLREISDVWVMCNLTGTLNSPITAFQLLLPANSAVKNNPTIDNKLKTINRDQNEVSKQSTYLIVFKSFAPQAAIVTSDLNQELLNNTISGVINSILSNSVQNFFYKLFGASLDVNFNYSRVATSLVGTPGAGASQNQNTRENVSLEFIKSLVNNRLIITFGSDFNFNAVGSTAVANQSFLFLPDVNVEYKITPDGKFRTSFFYRSSFDVLSSSGRRERTGGNLSFRTEFDHLLWKRREKKE